MRKFPYTLNICACFVSNLASMSNFIEVQRSNIQEIGIIEDSLSRRLLRNPYILPSNLQPRPNILVSKVTKPNSTKRISILQQYELGYFKDRYNQIIKGLNHCLTDEKESFSRTLELITEPGDGFEKFDEMINGISLNDNIVEDPRKLYSSFSSLNKELNPQDVTLKINKKTGKEQEFVKRKHFLSSIASHLKNIEINDILDLHHFHDLYVSNFGPILYIEYLYKFLSFPYTNVNGFYSKYLTELSRFLEATLLKLQPLLDYNALLQNWKKEYDNANEERKSNGNDGDKLFCKACNKLFSKETVYQSHLSGKKHKKNASQQNPDNFVSSLPWLEYFIEKLCQVLAPELEYTRAQVEKLSNLSERELQLDRQVQHNIENEFVAINNEFDDDDLSQNEHGDDDDNDDYLDDSFKNLPLGPDGTPIPFWLYKLQELHKQYNCEICGNISYKGKSVFMKHFSGSKHQYGLKCLGVDEKNMKMFKNITKIDEATELWKVLRKETKLKVTELENSVEVEDKEGNVMLEKDYIDLKKQGLL